MANKERLNKITQIANNEEAAVALFNENVDKVNRAIEDSLSRTNALPNNMKADLDMGDNTILNIKMRPVEKRDDGDVVVWGEIKDFTGASKRAEDAAVRAEGWKNEAKEAADLASARASDSEDFSDLAQAWAIADDLDDRLEGESSSKAYSNLAMAIANAPEDVPVNMSELQSRTILKGDSATVTIANVSTLPAGQEAYVENIGNERDVVLQIGLPRAENDYYSQGNLGDIRATTSTVLPKGCEWVDGQWFTKAQYPDMYEAVKAGQVAVTSSADYDAKISSEGCCAFFVLDETGERFRVPTLKGNLMFGVASGVSPYEYGKYQSASLPQHGHAIKTNVNASAYVETNLTYNPVEAKAFNAAISHYAAQAQRVTSMLSTVANYEGGSPIGSVTDFRTGTTVQPEAILLRYYVVLSENRKSIYCPKPSVATFADLPMSGNILGDTRVVLDTSIMYVWAQTLKGSYAWSSLGSATPTGGSAQAEWGSISGDILQQADLQLALDRKITNNAADSTGLALGLNATGTGVQAIAVGVGTYATQTATAIGARAKSDAVRGIAIGQDAYASFDAIAVGGTSASEDFAISLGESAFATKPRAIQIGTGHNDEEDSLYVGFNVVESYPSKPVADNYIVSNYSVVNNWKLLDGLTGKIPAERLPDDIFTGYLQNLTTQNNSVTIAGTAATGVQATNIGFGSTGTGTGATSVGYNAKATTGTVAVGISSEATVQGAVAIGPSAKAKGSHSIQIGRGTNSEDNSVYMSTSQTDNWKLLGSDGLIPAERLANAPQPDLTGYLQNLATGTNSFSLNTAITTGNATSYGTGSSVTAPGGNAFGWNSKAAKGSNAIGTAAQATAEASIALGGQAKATATRAIQIGIGTNSEANSVYISTSATNNWKLLGSDGKIPGERISLQGTTAPDTATVGSIGQFYVDTATGTGYMCVGADTVTPAYTWKQITI